MKAKELKKIADKVCEERLGDNQPFADAIYEDLVNKFTELAADGICTFSFNRYAFKLNERYWSYNNNELKQSPKGIFSIVLEKLESEGFNIMLPQNMGALLGNQPDPAHVVTW